MSSGEHGVGETGRYLLGMESEGLRNLTFSAVTVLHSDRALLNPLSRSYVFRVRDPYGYALLSSAVPLPLPGTAEATPQVLREETAAHDQVERPGI